MKKVYSVLLILFALTIQAQDVKKCETAEPSYMNRMPGFFLSDCVYSEFNSYNFGANMNGQYNSLKKEGEYRELWYKKNPAEVRKLSRDQIFKNYSDAFLKVKGKILADDKSVMTAVINGKEVYIHINAFPDRENVDNYYVKIIEVAKMQQDIVVTMQEAMDNEGKAVLYGILFDVGKSVIKPESTEALTQITNYLNANPKVNVIVVGHTDNTGGYANNKTLSKARAESIISYLVNTGKISAARLLSDGVGQSCPVSTNETEVGRKLNRRVEIVKQ